MQTARRAGTSIGQPFDNDVTTLDNVLQNAFRRRLGVRVGRAVLLRRELLDLPRPVDQRRLEALHRPEIDKKVGKSL